MIRLPIYVRIVLLLLGAVLSYHLLQIAAPVLIPLAFAFVLALLLYPLCKALEKIRIPRAIAIILSMLVITAVLGGLFFVLSSEILGFADDIPVMKRRLGLLLSDLQVFIQDRFGVSPEGQIDWLRQGLNTFMERSGESISSVINTTTDLFAKIGIIPFYIFFILYYRDLFKEFVFRVTKQNDHEQVAIVMKKIQQVVQNYLVGLITVMIIIAILNITGLMLIGVKHALFFGVFAALLTIIPYIGVFIGSALPVLYSLTMSDTLLEPALVFGIFTLVQSLEGNLITPNIVGAKVSINPLIAIVVLFIGAEVWGIAGMILFVPMVAMVKVVCDHIPSLQPVGMLMGAEKRNLRFMDFWRQVTRNYLKEMRNKMKRKEPKSD